MKLDLGGTACYEQAHGAVGITLDGTTSDDGTTPYMIGDYNKMPFADASFDEAFGCCYLEEPYDFEELARVMKKGGKVQIGSCDAWKITRSHLGWNQRAVEEMMQDIGNVVEAAVRAGFHVHIRYEDRGDDPMISYPFFHLTRI